MNEVLEAGEDEGMMLIVQFLKLHSVEKDDAWLILAHGQVYIFSACSLLS